MNINKFLIFSFLSIFFWYCSISSANSSMAHYPCDTTIFLKRCVLDKIIREDNVDVLKKLINKRSGLLKKCYEKRHLKVIHLCAMYEAEKCLEFILKEHTESICYRDELGSTAMHWVVTKDPEGEKKVVHDIERKKKMIRMLLKYGCIADERNSNGITPLMIALENGFIDVSELLIESGAKIEAKSDKRYSVAHYVTENCREKDCLLDVMRFIQKKGEEKEICFLSDGGVILLDDVISSDIGEEVSRAIFDILSKNFDFLAKDDFGATPLDDFFKCSLDRSESHYKNLDSVGILGWIYLYLKEKGCKCSDIGEADSLYHVSSRSFLCNSQIYKEIISRYDKDQLLLPDRRGYTAAFYIVRSGSLECLKVLCEINKKCLDELSGGGRSLLSFAVEYGRYNIVQFLLENRADVNAQDDHGKYPLDYALSGRRVDLVELLLEHGACDFEKMSEHDDFFSEMNSRINILNKKKKGRPGEIRNMDRKFIKRVCLLNEGTLKGVYGQKPKAHSQKTKNAAVAKIKSSKEVKSDKPIRTGKKKQQGKSSEAPYEVHKEYFSSDEVMSTDSMVFTPDNKKGAIDDFWRDFSSFIKINRVQLSENPKEVSILLSSSKYNQRLQTELNRIKDSEGEIEMWAIRLLALLPNSLFSNKTRADIGQIKKEYLCRTSSGRASSNSKPGCQRLLRDLDKYAFLMLEDRKTGHISNWLRAFEKENPESLEVISKEDIGKMAYQWRKNLSRCLLRKEKSRKLENYVWCGLKKISQLLEDNRDDQQFLFDVCLDVEFILKTTSGLCPTVNRVMEEVQGIRSYFNGNSMLGLGDNLLLSYGEEGGEYNKKIRAHIDHIDSLIDKGRFLKVLKIIEDIYRLSLMRLSQNVRNQLDQRVYSASVLLIYDFILDNKASLGKDGVELVNKEKIQSLENLQFAMEGNLYHCVRWVFSLLTPQWMAEAEAMIKAGNYMQVAEILALHPRKANEQCYSQEDHQMFKWILHEVIIHMKKGLERGGSEKEGVELISLVEKMKSAVSSYGDKKLLQEIDEIRLSYYRRVDEPVLKRFKDECKAVIGDPEAYKALGRHDIWLHIYKLSELSDEVYQRNKKQYDDELDSVVDSISSALSPQCEEDQKKKSYKIPEKVASKYGWNEIDQQLLEVLVDFGLLSPDFYSIKVPDLGVHIFYALELASINFRIHKKLPQLEHPWEEMITLDELNEYLEDVQEPFVANFSTYKAILGSDPAGEGNRWCLLQTSLVKTMQPQVFRLVQIAGMCGCIKAAYFYAGLEIGRFYHAIKKAGFEKRYRDEYMKPARDTLFECMKLNQFGGEDIKTSWGGEILQATGEIPASESELLIELQKKRKQSKNGT